MLLNRSKTPVLPIDKPWEQGAIACAVAAFVETDGKAVRLYYRMGFAKEPLRNVLCMARTRDLKTWEKPDLGDGSNVVMRSSGHPVGYGTFLPCRILHDPALQPAPWLMLYWERLDPKRNPGFCIASSPDGLRWTPVSDLPYVTNSNDAGSMIAVRPDTKPPIGKAAFFLYQQTWKYNPNLPRERDNVKGIHRRISIWRIPGLDQPWRGPITILEPDDQDPPDVQFYWLSPFRTQTGYGGFLNCHHTGDQTMDVQLVASADGWLWQRLNERRPLLASGARGGFDCGMVSVWTEPFEWNDRAWVFYNGRATVHDHQLRYPDDPSPTPPDGIGLAEFDRSLFTIS